MRKSDLRSGMVVKIEGYFDGTSNGLKLVSGDFFFDMVGFELNKNFNESMVCDRFPQVKITEVYEIIDTYPLWAILKGGKGLKLVWKREKEIDWAKVPFGTKVIATDSKKAFKTGAGKRAIFVGYEPMLGGLPFIVANFEKDFVYSYGYCTIEPGQEIKEEWYK